MTLKDEVRSIVSREGVIARRQHPELAGSIDRLVRTGSLAAVLPGVYSAAASSRQRSTRLRALAEWDPDAVLLRRTAAQLTFWPTLEGDVVECATRTDRDRQSGFRFSRRRVPAELVLERLGLRMSVPALTALDLCDEHEADGIDRVLRARAATLPGLHHAFELTGGRRGNRDRRMLLLDSRDEPWSNAERLCHRLLRSARFTGWQSNLPVRAEGRLYYLDVAFPGSRLVIEVDGRLHETDLDLFESDRTRQNALVLDGWMVLRFTFRMLVDEPEKVVADIRSALAALNR